ncbi:cytochrome P450 [Micromonospora sp. RV43]|uniref:cytochrome P450 n=1 Tax=Micromonospora sp. RV43 TaxID=1661387 RepID=UPI00064C0BE3|nr:cytochrome P450 [Micromonospora sp. RV43]
MTHTSVADLTHPDIFVRGEHHAVFARLRQEDPVHWSGGPDRGGFWSLCRYADVAAAYRDHAAFSSSAGAVLGGSFRDERDTAAGKMLVASDLPRHRMIRQVLYPAFSPTMVARVGEKVSELVDQAVDRLVRDGGGDFATEVATELPAGAVMTMMNVGHAEAHELIGITRRMIGFRDPVFVDIDDDERLRLAWLQSEVFEYFADLVKERRREPGDDVVSILAHAEINGRRMTEDEILYNCMNVAVGGNETSSYTACTGLHALLTNPDQYELLLGDPELLPSALDEILRWSSTNAYVARLATRDTEIGGTEIRKGQLVALWNVSANFDEEQFVAPERFDIRRSPNRHLTYGSGLHRCIGAPTANAELSILYKALLGRGVRLELDGEARRLRSNFILGMTSLPVRVVAA